MKKKLLFELKEMLLDILRFIRGLLSIKVVILVVMGRACELSNWNPLVCSFTGVMIFLFVYLRDVQKPNSNLYHLIKAWLTHRNGNGYDSNSVVVASGNNGPKESVIPGD